MTRLFFLALSLMLIGSTGAVGQLRERYTVEEILPNCLSMTGDRRRPTDPPGAMYDDGACLGIFSMMLFTGSELDPRIRFCAPRTMKLEEFAKTIVRYIELAAAQPNSNAVTKTDFRTIALGFAAGIWPCPK